MIPIPTGVRVWLATGHTDMRCGFPSLALRVQEILKKDPLTAAGPSFIRARIPPTRSHARQHSQTSRSGAANR
ncbi:MAG: hypothetical protein EOQ55_23615 [Mesorhizobium sp.]|nr:MAG: hypothetical protein EOQ55_23615 [Mesorhizobium sp.]RWI86367.1 MAG: hypothetical protein EOR22_30005 [Mesorhizobium sp.]